MAKCRDCRAPIVFFKHPNSPKKAPFDAKALDGHHPNLADAYPVMGASAYRPSHLAEQIQVQRACSDTTAADEVRDMQWFRIHRCTPTPPEGDTQA